MKILVRMIALGSVLAIVACAPAKPIRNAIADARPAFVAGPTPDFVSAPVAGATPFPPMAGATPFPNGANALFIGHSFFVPISRSFDEIALSSGAFPQHRHQEVFSGGKSGTPRELWDSQQKRAAVTAILADGDIDLLGLTHGGLVGSEQADYQRWIDLALQYNPRTSFMIGSLWATGGTNNTIPEFRAQTQASADYGWWMIQSLRQANPGVAFYHLAHGPMMVEMREDFEAGELDDITELVGRRVRDDVLFTDANLGHAGTMAKDLMALVWLQELYGLTTGAARLNWDAQDVNRLVAEVAAQNAVYN